MKRMLNILVAESERNRALREVIPSRWRIRHGASEEECLDLAYAGAADVMLIDLDDPVFADPEFVSRARFVARNAFPILGVSRRSGPDLEQFLACGLAEALPGEGLTRRRLKHAVRHWVRYRRLQRRVQHAERRALRWWKDLVDALDEVRQRLERGGDALDAFAALLEGADGDLPDRRREHLGAMRQHLAELNQVAADLDLAARTIQLKGLERSQRQAQSRRPAVSVEQWLETGELREEGECSLDRPPTRSAPPGRRPPAA